MSPLSPTLSLEKGEGAFGEAAARLAGLSAALLHWRPGEFWDATPQELATALTPLVGEAEGPDADTIAALRRQHPDQEKVIDGR